MRVTVGLPFLNAEETLADAIRSVFAQTVDDWELILLDDGSIDRSLEIARSVRDDRVRVISDGVNRGLHSRLNEIAQLARGEYLARLDADDMLHPCRIERQLEILEEGGADMVGTAMYVMDAQTNIREIRDAQPVDTRPITVLSHGAIAHATVTGRTQWFRENSYDEAFLRAEDYELWCRTCSRTRFDKVREALYFVREGARSPRRYLADYVQSARSVRRALLKHGPRLVGWPGTVRQVVRSHLKELAYRVATPIGLQESLIRMRGGEPLNEFQAAQAQVILARIAETAVPGLRG